MINRYDIKDHWVFSLAYSPYPTSAFPNAKIKLGKQFPAEVPGTIHTDLLRNKLIEDPFYSDNESRMNWISECDWIYQTKFNFNVETNNNINLVFEGLDTICEIYLNGTKLGGSDNMFITYRYNVRDILKESNNILKLIIKSPVRYASQQEIKYGKLPVALNSSRVHIRKAQYSFGWDWGPSFPTSGIWRGVYLEEWAETRIKNVSFNTIKLYKNYAHVEVILDIERINSNGFSLLVSLSDETNIYEKKIQIQSSNNFKINFKINNPRLWWPNGEGEQPLYCLQIKIVKNDETVIDEVRKKVGIRKIELILKEKEVSTFKFRINNKDIYCKGVNWIPGDSFLPRISNKKYSQLLGLAKNANVNMVRVWGGGIYENDEFYDLCDELGILVWQDFMFACGSYPENDEFRANVEEEINQNVLRLQYHACLAIWCGNNENEWIWFNEQKCSYKKMPGYIIYHNIIPKILNKIDPLRPYWPSSPFGFDEDPNSFNTGNNHQWNIWSKWVDYEEVKHDNSLFITEFGFQGPANKDTFEKYLPIENRNISDRLFEYHNKQIEGPERIVRFLSGHLPIITEWDNFLYLTQLNQAFALKTSLEHWRTSKKTNGSIIWQINDCWPVTSWSIIDSEIKPKIAYYFVKNAFAAQLIYFKDDGSRINIYLLNHAGKEFNRRLRLTVIDSTSGEIVEDSYYNVKIGNKEHLKMQSISRKNLIDDENWILSTVLYNESDEVICRNYYLTKPWKHLKLKEPKIKLKLLDDGGEVKISVKSSSPAFFIDLYHPHFTFSDRGFSILPDETINLKVSGKGNRSLKINDIRIFLLNNFIQQ